MNKETYGFKPKHHFDIASSLKFRNTTDDFQKQLKEDISSVNSSSEALIFADKVKNIYKTTVEQYKKTLKGQHNEDLQKIFRSFREVD